MEEFVIKNRAGVTNRFIKIEDNLYDDGHYTVHKNSGNDWYLRTDAHYIREIRNEDGSIFGIDPEGGLPVNMLCVGDEINGMKVKEFKVFEKAYPINSPVSNIVVIFE